MKYKLLKSGAVLGVLALLLSFLLPITYSPETLAQNVPCYFQSPVGSTQKFVAASGCEIEVRSGATFDLQDGATVDFSSGIDLDGSILTWDPTGNTTAVASLDNVITYTLGAATGRIDILTGSLKIGNGTPDTTLNGEDVYVEGTLEVDGSVNLDGAVDIAGNLTSATGAVTIADTLNATGAVDFDSTLNVDGNLASATGALTIADSLNATGAVDFDSTLNVDGTLASATGALTIADTFNVTDTVDFDSTLNVDGATTLTGTTTLSATTLADDLTLRAQTVFSVVMGIPITPTGVYMPIQSAVYVTGGGTADIAAGTTNGDLLALLNINATQAITVDGTGSNVECKADVILAAGDTLMLMWDASDWRCLSGYDNS